MPDRLEGRLRWLFGATAVVIGASGVLALRAGWRAATAPSAVGLGERAAASVPDVVAPLAFVAVGAIVACALALLIAWSPRRYAHLMPLLALGFAVAGALLVASRLAATAETAAPGALGWALACVALSAAALASWVALWLSTRASDATRARDGDLLGALLAGMVPAGGPFALGADDALVREDVVAAFRELHPRGRILLRAALRVLEARSLVKHRVGLAGLDRSAREAMLAGLAASRLTPLRHLGGALRLVVLARFYSDPRAQEAIGYDRSWVHERIAAGPNAEAHRARREAAARAAAEAAARVAADERAQLAREVGVDAGEDETPAPEASAAAREGSGPAEDAAPSREPAGPPAAAADPGAGGGGSRRHAGDAEPLERPWTLGLPAGRDAGTSGTAARAVMRVARSSGPTRP